MNTSVMPLDCSSVSPLMSTTKATSKSSLCSAPTLPAKNTSSSSRFNNNYLPASVMPPTTSDLDNLTWPPLVINTQALNISKTPAFKELSSTPSTFYTTIPTSMPLDNLMNSVDKELGILSKVDVDKAGMSTSSTLTATNTLCTNPMMNTKLQKELSMLAQKGEDAIRNQKEKLKEILEETKRKNEEIIKETFRKLKVKEYDKK